MTSPDEQALLAAITADPADDTARLVYADWLDEHDRSARAELIRVQIEAERHHPNSPRRAELDARARALLAEHWVDWWAPVCEAVGLPVPKRRRASRLGRLLEAVRPVVPESWPYHLAGTSVARDRKVEWVPDVPTGIFARVEFCRGFPDTPWLIPRQPGGVAECLTRWATATPLDRLVLCGAAPESWTDGPYLRGLRALSWGGRRPGELLTTLADSCHLDRLEEVSILGIEETEDQMSVGLSRFLAHPLARQLRRFHLPVMEQLTAQSLAGAAGLSGLTSLSIELQRTGFARAVGLVSPVEAAAAGERLAVLARSPHLAGLTELTVIGLSDPAGCRALSVDPTWAGLRKLTLVADLDGDAVEAFLADATLPALEELSVGGVALTPRSLDQLVRSPLMKQLRHISFSSWLVSPIPADELRRFPDIFDPKRVETLTLALDPKIPGLDELRRRLGSRMRILEQ